MANNNNGLKAGAAAIIIIAAGIITFQWMNNGGDAGSEDFPDGIHYICLNPDCQEDFTISKKELMEFKTANPDARSYPCPNCGSEQTLRAEQCPHCGKNYRNAEVKGDKGYCPRCGEELPQMY